MRKNFTSEQMLYTVRQAESGTPVAEVCRKLGITEQTFYKWKRREAGMGIAELTRLRQLEGENKKLTLSTINGLRHQSGHHPVNRRRRPILFLPPSCRRLARLVFCRPDCLICRHLCFGLCLP